MISMKVIEGQKYITIGEVARKIGRTPQTLKNWISWLDNQNEEDKHKYFLPKAITDLDEKNTRYFEEDDVSAFDKFKILIQEGDIDMSDFSITRWGKRGEEIQQRKEENRI
jgi:predicted transcriptional regulator